MVIEESTSITNTAHRMMAEKLPTTRVHEPTEVEIAAIGRHRTNTPIHINYTSPYTLIPSQSSETLEWRTRTARYWVQWHLGISLGLMGIAGILLTATNQVVLGIYLLCFGLGTLALNASALSFAGNRLPGGATILTLAADILLVICGLVTLGTHLELFLLLPGSLLIAALLVDLTAIIIGTSVAFALYVIAIIHDSTANLPITTSISPLFWQRLTIGLACIGFCSLLIALALVIGKLRQALADQAALSYQMRVLERRIQQRQIVLDADAIALQTALATSLRGGHPHAITTCEELAPLANMTNATIARIPGLLNDREERLRLEKAVRDLTHSLEAAWAGFDLQWPAPSNTAIDRLVTMLRPGEAVQ